MRMVEQRSDLVRGLILASTTAYQDYELERATTWHAGGVRGAGKEEACG
jgi:hypothetical protein